MSELKFTEEFLNNKLFKDQIFSIDKPCREQAHIPADVGAQTLENGDIIFRLYAPCAQKIRLWGFQEIEMKKQADGMFVGKLVYQRTRTGIQTIHVELDGTEILYPYLPIYWTENHPNNYVEVPEPDSDYMMIRKNPHGALVREIYWSETMKDFERCMVYTPPGYMNGEKHYPVLYLQNGGSDNETSWEYAGRISHIADNLLEEGRMVPCIIVMNNGMLRKDGEIRMMRDKAFDQMLTKDCIPYIEHTYRVIGDKWSRGIAGLSMGAYMSNDIGFWHPELFGYIGQFTASMTHEEIQTDYERPYFEVMKDREAFARNYRIFFRSTTFQEDHFEYFEADDLICRKAGIDRLPGYHRIVYDRTVSKWNSWRMGARDYLMLIFR